MSNAWTPSMGFKASCGVCSGIFLGSAIILLILAAIATPRDCEDETTEHCVPMEFSFGDVYRGMLYHFLGVSSEVSEHLVFLERDSGLEGKAAVTSVCFVLATVMGKAWLFLSAFRIIFYIIPRTRSTDNANCSTGSSFPAQAFGNRICETSE
eukprot:TRINITY_DN14325_c0_g1_i1.p1 TRINITY_DN14325_c0_g1~~TRINITY_DN14325_c0_g1_i1.p1  ORF type:complete len:153 (+),score=14.77 TRINITY_DN14325_c0_g1_i1:96-554(+)